MTNHQPRSRCRILSIALPRQATTVQTAPVALLSLIFGQRVINLGELARAIASDCNLCSRVTEAACQEFGSPWLSVEQAIVLLGRERLAGHILRRLHTNRNPPAEQLRLPEMFQGISE
jgi:hypothetical protein